MKLNRGEITKLIKKLEQEKVATIRGIDERIKGLRVLQQNIGFLTGEIFKKGKATLLQGPLGLEKRARIRKRVKGVGQKIENYFHNKPGLHTVSEVAQGLFSSGFKSSSKNPKAMISGLVLKLFKEKKLSRKKKNGSFAYQIMKGDTNSKPKSKPAAKNNKKNPEVAAAKTTKEKKKSSEGSETKTPASGQ